MSLTRITEVDVKGNMIKISVANTFIVGECESTKAISQHCRLAALCPIQPYMMQRKRLEDTHTVTFYYSTAFTPNPLLYKWLLLTDHIDILHASRGIAKSTPPRLVRIWENPKIREFVTSKMHTGVRSQINWLR